MGAQARGKVVRSKRMKGREMNVRGTSSMHGLRCIFIYLEGNKNPSAMAESMSVRRRFE